MSLERNSSHPAEVTTTRLFDRSAAKAPPEPMPLPDQRTRLAMRDGIRLDTQVWLPATAGRVPAILMRRPYKESVLGFKRLGMLRYVEAGYAIVIQMVRGCGASEGRFTFNAPHERSDGHDTVEWVAAQPWCDGNVGMDGSSYSGMMQLSAAAERPPHLRCIVPAVPSVNFFREAPYFGGAFSRMHTMNWAHLLQVDSLAELSGGFLGLGPLLTDPAVWQRMTSRPTRDAADAVLQGDHLQHYREVLAHPTHDAWWRERTLQRDDYAAIDLPTLVVTGNFDLSIGALGLWRELEANAQGADSRQLLIGPWDHAQCYAGGGTGHAHHAWGESALRDLFGARLAFFDRHLKGRGPGPELMGRVTVFITGANTWRGFDTFPPRQVAPMPMYLHSGGGANSARGDGTLSMEPPDGAQAADAFVDDPALPIVSALAEARGPGFEFDLRERERQHEVLVYDSGPLGRPVTLLGEGEAELFVAADVPDADIVVTLAEHRSDGGTWQLAFGQLRLRYRDGYDQERLLVPGEVVHVHVPLTYIGHQVAADSSLRLLVGGSNFPFTDPNPHTGEPIATALEQRVAVQRVFHDSTRPSRLVLPVLRDEQLDVTMETS